MNKKESFSIADKVVPTGSLASPSLTGKKSNTTLVAVMDHFGVSQEDIQRVLVVALENGGDYADLFFEHSFNNSVGLQDGKVNRCNSTIDFGVGVRVVSGDQTGYAYVEDINSSTLLDAAKTASRIAAKNRKTIPVEIDRLSPAYNYYKVDTPWEEVLLNDKMPLLQEVNDLIFDLDKRVIKVTAILSDKTSHILFFNSLGDSYYDYRPLVAFNVSCVMQEGNRFENGSASRSYRMGFEFLSQDLVKLMAKEVVDNTSILFEAIKPQGGEMPVVMGAGGSGILLHEAIGHAFEADFNRKKTSIFSEQLNKQICSNHINVLDDGTIPFNRGAVNIDDEGVLGQKTYLVKEGVLTNYLHDRISASHYGVDPTGNGRRESFRHIPIPRMRSTYMEAGNYSESEIIASVKKGVYVDNFTNGQVKIGAGDFTFFVKSGFLIEEGKLTQPIKDINIIGNGPQALADITMVGNNETIDNGTWNCGKAGQTCPVTCGMPTTLVKKLTVGGDS